MSPAGMRRRAAVGAWWIGCAKIITLALQLLQLAVLARLLTPEDFGLIALVSIVVGLAQTYADAGQSGAIIHRQDATAEQLSSLFWLSQGIGFLLFLGLLLFAPLIGMAYREPELSSLIGLAAVAFLVAPLGQQPGLLLQKALRFEVLALIDVIAAAAGVSVAIALAFGGMGVHAVVWGQLGTVVARTVAQVAFGRREWRPLPHFRLTDLKGYLRFGFFQMAERTVNFLGANLDKLLVGSLIGTKALGYYSVAYQLVMRPMQVVNPVFTRVAFPLFAKVQTDNERLRAGFLVPAFWMACGDCRSYFSRCTPGLSRLRSRSPLCCSAPAGKRPATFCASWLCWGSFTVWEIRLVPFSWPRAGWNWAFT
jgi:O-antigen/teichoic acid export membrane protein